ncbi:MAG: hypothetical protein DRJ47_01840 [Thermoprotei archaeon]|nr:MAG: hypothetical protein DRJ47_01840 [Thermoprotei archaeon]
MFVRYVPWMIYAGDRDIYEVYFTVINRPGELRNALEVFAKYKVNILNISAHSSEGLERAPVFTFVELTDKSINIEEVKKELERVTGSEVYLKSSPVKGFMMDELAFPLYVFPGVRSIIMLENDFTMMVKGLYERLGYIAATFLYHLAFSGGRFMAEYLSRKLGLKGKTLLLEILKFYQAGGWGRVELVEYRPENFEITLRLHDSIECKIFRDGGKPSSHFIRGHLSGLLSKFLNAEIRMMESKCIAAGDPFCEFYTEKIRGRNL